MQGIGRKIASGTAWMVMFKLIERSIGLVSTIILARLLVPTDFGLVAMAMAIVALVELIQAFGFDIALIQNQHASREDYDTAWTLNVFLALTCSIVVSASARAVAIFYGEPRVE